MLSCDQVSARSRRQAERSAAASALVLCSLDPPSTPPAVLLLTSCLDAPVLGSWSTWRGSGGPWESGPVLWGVPPAVVFAIVG